MHNYWQFSFLLKLNIHCPNINGGGGMQVHIIIIIIIIIINIVYSTHRFLRRKLTGRLIYVQYSISASRISYISPVNFQSDFSSNQYFITIKNDIEFFLKLL